MSRDVIAGDLYVAGNLGAGTFSPPPASIGDAAIAAAARVQSTKLTHRRYPIYTQGVGVTAAAFSPCMHVAVVGGVVQGINVGAHVAPVGNAVVTIDLKKNGSSILTGTFQLTSSTAAFATVAGTLASTTLAAGDVLEAIITVNAGSGTLPTGLFVQLVVDEYGQ